MENQMLHTPTPWSEDKYGTVKAAGEAVVIEGFSLSCGPRNPVSLVNKEFIIRAVNSHDALVAALKQVRVELKPDGMQANWQILQALFTIDKALAEAEKP